MARPARNNAEYFTHPASFHNDRRVKALRTRFGAAGYGLLMMLLEALTDADHTQLPTDELELELLAGDFGVSVTEIDSLLQAAEKTGLFARNEQGFLICPDLNKWLEPVFEKRNRARNAEKTRLAAISVTETLVTVAETPQSKVKESKEEKSKEKEKKETSASASAPAPVDSSHSEFAHWQAWAKEHAPQVLRMKAPLTAEELKRLTAEFSQSLVLEVFEAMHNHAPLLRKYNSANLTVRQWLKNRAADAKGGSTQRGSITGALAPKNVNKTISQQSGPRL